MFSQDFGTHLSHFLGQMRCAGKFAFHWRRRLRVLCPRNRSDLTFMDFHRGFCMFSVGKWRFLCRWVIAEVFGMFSHDFSTHCASNCSADAFRRGIHLRSASLPSLHLSPKIYRPLCLWGIAEVFDMFSKDFGARFADFFWRRCGWQGDSPSFGAVPSLHFHPKI